MEALAQTLDDLQELIDATESLVLDILDMATTAPSHDREDIGTWFGPFSESNEDFSYGGGTSVSWPNLMISAQKVNLLLAKVKNIRS